MAARGWHRMRGAPEVGSRSPRSRRPANSVALKKLTAELSMYVGPKANIPWNHPGMNTCRIR